MEWDNPGSDPSRLLFTCEHWQGQGGAHHSASLVTPASKDLASLSRAPTGMFRQWSVPSGPAPRRSESQASSEDLWKQEVERLCASRTPVRMLPYAMADKRFIRWVLLSHTGPGMRVGAPGDAPVRWMTQGRPITMVLQETAGARGREELLLAAVASPEAGGATAAGGGSKTAGPRFRALGGSSLRDWR